MTRLPRNTASYCCVPSATYASPAETGAEVTEYRCLCGLEHRFGGRVAGNVTEVRCGPKSLYRFILQRLGAANAGYFLVSWYPLPPDLLES
jgi:hypothetical protein